jgi:hypothetical protein
LSLPPLQSAVAALVVAALSTCRPQTQPEPRPFLLLRPGQVTITSDNPSIAPAAQLGPLTTSGIRFLSLAVENPCQTPLQFWYRRGSDTLDIAVADSGAEFSQALPPLNVATIPFCGCDTHCPITTVSLAIPITSHPAHLRVWQYGSLILTGSLDRAS